MGGVADSKLPQDAVLEGTVPLKNDKIKKRVFFKKITKIKIAQDTANPGTQKVTFPEEVRFHGAL